jgi:hypothetical protein
MIKDETMETKEMKMNCPGCDEKLIKGINAKLYHEHHVFCPYSEASYDEDTWSRIAALGLKPLLRRNP